MAVDEQAPWPECATVTGERPSKAEYFPDVRVAGQHLVRPRLHDIVEAERGPVVGTEIPKSLRFRPPGIEEREDVRDAPRLVRWEVGQAAYGEQGDGKCFHWKTIPRILGSKHDSVCVTIKLAKSLP